MHSIKNKLLSNQKSDFKTIISNIFSLSLLNILNYAFPLILIPYLVKILGAESFGLQSFSYSFLQYFVLIVNYGFQFSATKELAISRDNNLKVSLIFSSVIVSRLILSLVCTIFLFLVLFFIPSINAEWTLFLMGIGIFWGQALMPVWLFQGMEKMKYITILVLVSKVVTFILVLFLVRDTNDYEFVNLSYSIGFLVSGITGVLIAIVLFKIKLIFPRKSMIIRQFKNGWHLFFSTVGMNLYTETNTVILGFLVPYQYVGYFSAADKIVRVVKSLISPVSQALFPFFGRKLQKNNQFQAHNINKFIRVGKLFFVFMFILSIVTIILAPFIIKNFLGIEFQRSIYNVQIMSVSILFGASNFYFGIIGLINLNKEKSFTKFVWLSGLVSVLSCLLLSKYFLEYSASIATSIAELLLFILIINKLHKTTSRL